MVKTNNQSVGDGRRMVFQSSQGSSNGVASKSTVRPKLSCNVAKSHYKGVRMRSWGSWVSEIRAPNQKTRIWLGSYSTPEAAARAYDAALLCLKGTSASLNFPTSAHLLHLPDTVMSPKSIQRVAAAAAAANATTAPPTGLAPSPQSTSSTSQSPEFHSPSPSQSSEATDDVEAATISGAQAKEESLVIGDCLFDWSIDCDAFFQSPKCMDYMLHPSAFFAPPQVEEYCDWGEEGEISLWSFC